MTAIQAKLARPLTFTGVAITACSLVLAAITATYIPDELRLRYHIGTHVHWGPATAPSELVTLLIPALVLGSFGLTLLLMRRESDHIGHVLAIVVALATMALLLVLQGALVALNLVIPP